MNAETISLVIKIVLGVISLVSTGLSVLLGFKSGKYKNLFKNIKAVSDHTSVLIGYIEEAESHTNYESSDKLEYVITKYRQYCLDNDVKFDLSEVTESVEELIELTKEVNSKNKSLKY